MSSTLYFWVAGVSVLLWAPIFIRFLRQWWSRDNPVSLAICAAILLIMWWAVAGIWLVTGQADTTVVVFSTAGASILTAFCAHFAFYRSRTKFPDQRTKKRS